jgi:hypothetical protein
MSTHAEAVEDIKKAVEALDSVDTTESPKSSHPDPKKHLYISLIKKLFLFQQLIKFQIRIEFLDV